MAPCQKCHHVRDYVLQLSTAVSEFELYDAVADLNSVPESRTFERAFVARNRPCVIRNAVSHWPAVEKWSLDYVSEKMGAQKCMCTFSNNGKADSVHSLPQGDVFLLPDNRESTISEFTKLFRDSKNDAAPFVPSIQYQNDNMSEFGCLAADFDTSFPWAFQAFDSVSADAVNLWIGDSRSSTTYHKACSLLPEDPETPCAAVLTIRGVCYTFTGLKV
jgi:Cupin-like domain